MTADQAMAAVKARAPAPPSGRHRRPGGESKPFEGDARKMRKRTTGYAVHRPEITSIVRATPASLTSPPAERRAPVAGDLDFICRSRPVAPDTDVPDHAGPQPPHGGWQRRQALS